VSGGRPGTAAAVDITEIILSQHHDQRRAFAQLDEIDPADTAALAAVWNRLQVLLEVHAEAEERFFYPVLLRLGKGAEDDGPDDEVEDAIKDHNEIRDAVRAASGHEVGSEQWWQAVREAREANDDHMGEEERDDLPDFRRHADLQTRHDIAVRFLQFEGENATGIRAVDKDPEQYVAENS
jgi:Hemerythrin HHE cation binding domain